MVAAFAAPGPRLAHADDAPVAVRLEYVAEDGCPNEEAFLAEVSTRTNRLVVAADDSPAILIKAHLRKGGEQLAFRGTLVFVRRASEAARDVEGASCQEVAEALAVVVAMTLDPDRGRPRRVTPPPKPVPSAPPSAEPLPPAAPPLIPIVLAPAPRLEPEPRPRSFFAATSLGAGVTSAMAPWPAWYGEIALELRHPTSTPAARASFSYAGRSSYETQEGSSDFRWLGTRVEACFWALALAPDFAVEPWIGFEAGAIGTTGRTANGSASHWRGWAAPDATLRMRWIVAEPVALSLAAGGVIPLVRDSFYLQSSGQTVFRPPGVGVRAGIEASLHFW